MDKLSELPSKDTELSSAEKHVMETYFSSKDGSAKHGGKRGPSKWKLAGYAILLFLALSNNYVDHFVQKRVDNPLLVLMIKSLAFGILLILIYRFV